MIYGAAVTLDGANDAATLNFNSASAGNSSQVVSARFKGKATTNVDQVVTLEVLNPGTTDWTSTGGIDMKSLQIVAAGSISVTNSTDFDYMIPDVGATWGARLRTVSITSGSHSATGIGLFATEVPRSFLPVTLAAATTNISASSATALTVGPNGTMNPTFVVVTNVSSEATGVKITGAAAAGGVAIAAISSGTDEPMTIDAKGAGVLSLNTTATGQVYMGRGAKKVTVQGLTVTALGTVQSSTPTIANMLTGILTQTGATGAGTVTFPTGTAISAGMPLTPATGDSFDMMFANLGGSQTLTLTGATGTTMLGTVAVGTGKNATMKAICTGSNAWSVYCMVSA